MAGQQVRIFGIGLNKTGTRSLATALRMLGYRTLHKGDDATSRLVDDAAEQGLPLLQLIGDHFDAYLDVDAIVHRYAELDAEHPRSKFILTSSELTAWLDSRQRHVEANQQRAAEGRYTGSFLTVDRAKWTSEWEEHHQSVQSHFSGRSGDLLVFDVRSGDGWETLAPFLGRRAPRAAFPWENRAGRGTYSSEHTLARYRRRATFAAGRVNRWFDERRSRP